MNTQDLQFIQNEDLINIIQSASTRIFAEELNEIPSSLDFFQNGLCTNFINGLSGNDIEQRSFLYGTNRKPDPPPLQYWSFLYSQFQELKSLLLIIFSIAIIVIGNLTDIDHVIQIEGITLLIIVVVSCIYLALIEFQKEKQVQYQQLVMENRKTVKAWRNGELISIEQSQIMVGDILQIQVGIDIQVDSFLIEGSQILIDVNSLILILILYKESAITGYCDPVRKDTYQNCVGVRDRIIEEGRKEESSKYDVPSPILFSGTKVISGEGKMLVLVVGGQCIAAQQFTEINEECYIENLSPFEAKLQQTANNMKRFGLIFVFLIFFVAILRIIINILIRLSFVENDLIAIFQNIIFALTLIILTNPYGLCRVLTFSTEYSLRRVLYDNVLVRKQSSFLQLGLVNQICTDKTGTLTLNKNQVFCIWHDQIKNINPSKERIDLGTLIPHEIRDEIAQCLVLNNSAEIRPEETGNKNDQSYLYFVEKCGINYKDLRQKYEVSKRFPFSSQRKRQSVIVGNNLFQYGSGELILKECTKFHSDQSRLIQIDSPFRKNLEEVLNSMASQSLRTVALAYKQIQKEDNLDKMNDSGLYDIETSNLTLLCFIGIKQDTLREGVPRCIKLMKNAGIKVRMITGDNKLTAKKIAQECGIYIDETKSLVLEGNEFVNLIGGLICKKCQTQQCDCPKDEQTANKTKKQLRVDTIKNQQEFDDILPRLDILARSRPEDKYTLVAGLIQKGHVVAVIGDGTNDALALAKANIGIAMGIDGTEVAKESAGIILLDDNFNSIVKAIMWSKNIHESVKKFIQFQFTLNFVILFLMLIGVLFIQSQLLYPIQILWINLIVDIFASYSLAKEPPNHQLLESNPDNLQQSLISPKMAKHILGQTLYQLLILSIIVFAGDKFIPENSTSWDQQNTSLLQYKYSDTPTNNQYCDYINTCKLIASGRMYYLNGDEDYMKFYKYHQIPSRHFTFIFNTIVLMQMFNFINCRKIQDELNIFNGMSQNYFSLIFIIGLFIAQIIIVTFGDVVFGCYPYNGLSIFQWLISIAFASGVLIIRLILTQFYDFSIWFGSSNNNRIHDISPI